MIDFLLILSSVEQENKIQNKDRKKGKKRKIENMNDNEWYLCFIQNVKECLLESLADFSKKQLWFGLVFSSLFLTGKMS